MQHTDIKLPSNGPGDAEAFLFKYCMIFCDCLSKMRFINLPCKLLAIKLHPSLHCHVLALELDQLSLAYTGSIDDEDTS